LKENKKKEAKFYSKTQIMPPKKRAAKQPEPKDENTSDEEKYQPKSKRAKETNSSTNLKHNLEWLEHGESLNSKNIKPLYYLVSKALEGREKIASFDIDSTIISTKSGKTFAQNPQDWQFLDKSVPKKLKELHDADYRILFITNQGGLEKGNVKLHELKTKFEAILNELDIPVYILISAGETHYRKPSPEMWNFFKENCNKSVKVNMDESFYIGDAAGRKANWAPGRKKDFSCADRMFAANANLKFQTPEEYFMNYKKDLNFEWRSVDPNEIINKYSSNIPAKAKEYHSSEQEIVLLVGPPASGKSTFVKKYFLPHKYTHVNRDTLQTQEKCLKATEAALKEGKSVCVDNTNPSKSARSEFINLAKRLKVKQIRCFRMNTPLDLCHHLNYVRQTWTKGKVRRIPDVGYNVFKSKLEEPCESEGYKEILNIDFAPMFESEEEKRIFQQWTF
jgi:bifunctional polynucleotide phosphatase/kinase